MAVSNGQLANATTFNTAFMSRTANDNTTGKKDLQNVEAASGPDVINAQREVNSLNSFTGRASGSVYNVTPTWTNNDVGTSGDDLKERAEALTQAFDATVGHTHDGSTGAGGTIDASDLAGLNYFRAVRQIFIVDSGTGTTEVVTSSFGSKTAGGTSTVAGVVTTAPYNKCVIISNVDETSIVDAGGQVVYARLTESSGVWTLSFFTSEAGSETAYSFASSVSIRVYFLEVYNLASIPTFSEDAGYTQTLDMTADIVDASATQRGVVSTGAQTFGGDKDFNGSVRLRAALYLDSVNNASTGSSVTLTNPAVGIIRLTSGSLVSIDGISAPTYPQVISIFNATGVDIAILDDAAGTAADGVLTGTGSDFSFVADAAVLLVYDTTTARWRMIGGGGGSGGGALLATGTRASPQNVVAGTGIAFTGTDARQVWFIQGNAAGVNDVTANPQVAVGLTLGQELILIGRSNTNTVLLEDGNGLSLNGSYEMGEDSVLYLFWDSVNWVETSRRE